MIKARMHWDSYVINKLVKKFPASEFLFEGCKLINSLSVNICAHVYLFSDLNLGNNVSKYTVVFMRMEL